MKMGDSPFDVKFKDKEQGFVFAIVENLEGYTREFQAVIYSKSLNWRKEVGLETDNYFEALDELEYFYTLGFNFDGVIFNPVREVIHQ